MTPTFAQRASALLRTVLQESSVCFSIKLAMTECARSVAVLRKRSGDCRVSDINFAERSRSSNRIRWRMNSASMSESSDRASVDLREFGCDIMSFKVAMMAGRVFCSAHSEWYWQDHLISHSFFSSMGCCEGSSSLCFLVKWAWTNEPKKNL